jgi:hypothetical protein
MKRASHKRRSRQLKPSSRMRTEKCATFLSAVDVGSRPPSLACYDAAPTGHSSPGGCAPLGSLSLKANWLFGLNGMKLDLLDGKTSSTSRAFASDRTIKISASIATTFWIRTAEQPPRYGRPVHPKNCDRQHTICALRVLQSDLTSSVILTSSHNPRNRATLAPGCVSEATSALSELCCRQHLFLGCAARNITSWIVLPVTSPLGTAAVGHGW